MTRTKHNSVPYLLATLTIIALTGSLRAYDGASGQQRAQVRQTALGVVVAAERVAWVVAGWLEAPGAGRSE